MVLQRYTEMRYHISVIFIYKMFDKCGISSFFLSMAGGSIWKTFYTIEKIFPELFSFISCSKSYSGRCDNSGIHFDTGRTPPSKFLFLNDPRNFCLCRKVYLTYLIKKKGTAMSYLKSTNSFRICTGKRTFFMSK